MAIKNELTIINHVNLTKLANFSKTIVSDPEQTQDQEDPSPPSKKPKKGQGKAKKCKSKFDSPDIIDFDLKIDVNQGKSNLVLAVVFNDKIVKVLELDEDADTENSKLEVLSTYYVPKRPTSIKFDNFISKDKASSLSQNSKNHFLLIADKNGDVYRRWDKFEVEKIDKNPDLKIKNETPIIGHISMLLDLQVDEKYIFTADRDEKVRISHRERAFDIFGYLLGHTEFVSDVFLIEGVDRCLRGYSKLSKR